MRTYLQQYGKERTGTNVLKALLGRNFRNVVLFDNRLGSKHDEFMTPATWLRLNGVATGQDFAKLIEYHPFWSRRNRPSEDPFERIHQPVTWHELEQLRDGSLNMRYLVSIKDPYAFVISACRWFNPERASLFAPPSASSLDLSVARQQCMAFNAMYQSWSRVLESGDGVLVRHEDVLADYGAILRKISDAFQLEPIAGSWVPAETLVAPGIGDTGLPFDRAFYEQRQYMAALPSDARRSIAAWIDWDLMRNFGYCP